MISDKPLSPVRRILSRALQWLSFVCAALMVAGYFGLFGYGQSIRLGSVAVGFVAILACLVLAQAAAGYATVTETLGDMGAALREGFRPASARPSARRASTPRRRRIGWWVWLAVLGLSLTGAVVLPSGPDATGQALLAMLAVLLLLGGWLFRMKQVHGGWFVLGWLATIAVLIGGTGGMASVVGDHSGWLVIPATPLILVLLGGLFSLFPNVRTRRW